MHTNCLACERIKMIKQGSNPYFVMELDSGYVVLGDHQLFKGYSLLLLKNHTEELHMLTDADRKIFLEDMSLLGKALYEIYSPRKMNYEHLGNSVNHLHWHIFPRHHDDPRPQGAVWAIDKSIRYADKYIPSPAELDEMKKSLKTKLAQLILENS